MDGRPPVPPAARKRELQTFWSNETNLGIKEDERGYAVFPDGSPWALCTSHANAVIAREGGTRFGFWAEDNPSSAISRLHDGHDFALVDGCFIVDPWVMHVEDLAARCVFDLRDAADAAEVRRLYGDPRSWTPAADSR